MGIFLTILVTFLVAGLVIYIVGRLGLGLLVSDFGTAFVAAIFIAISAGILTWLIGLLGITVGGGIIGAIASLIMAALVLMFSGSLLPGLKVDGFAGAIIAVIFIGLFSWLGNWLLGLLGLL